MTHWGMLRQKQTNKQTDVIQLRNISNKHYKAYNAGRNNSKLYSTHS